MKNIEEIDEKVEKRKKQLAELFKKDEENYDLWAGKEQIFGDHKMDVNITGTEMSALARRNQSSLMRSRLDIHVWPPKPLSNPEATDTSNEEERMYYYGLEQADESLNLRGEASLRASASWQDIVLGRINVRILVYLDKKTGKIVWDFLPMNPRFVTFSFDDKGLAWYAYETFCSPESIKNEYGKEVTEDMQGRGVSKTDYWDREHNVRYLTKSKERLGKAWKHPFEEVPAIIQPVAGGPKAITSEGIQVTAWGQSIFDPAKIPFKNLNELRSIAATQAHMLAKRPTEEIYEDGTDPNIEEEHLDFHAGALIKHPKSIELKPMEVSDIPNSLPLMMTDIQTGIQRLTGAELHPEWAGSSGAALRIAGQDRQDVETPGIEAMNSMYTRICRMVKNQIRTLGLTIPVRTVVNDQYEIYDMKPEFLENDFYVQAELVRQDVYDEVEALQRGQLLIQNRLASRETVLDKIMKVQDVPAEIAKMDTEAIEAEIPEIVLKRVIKTYMDRGMYEEATQAKEKLFLLEAQQRNAVIPPEGEAGSPSPQGIGVP